MIFEVLFGDEDMQKNGWDCTNISISQQSSTQFFKNQFLKFHIIARTQQPPTIVQSPNSVHTWHKPFSGVHVLINHWKLHIVMNKNGLQVLENIYAAQRLILLTGVDIIQTFSDGEMWKPLILKSVCVISLKSRKVPLLYLLIRPPPLENSH